MMLGIARNGGIVHRGACEEGVDMCGRRERRELFEGERV
jgi:hypothetical protein